MLRLLQTVTVLLATGLVVWRLYFAGGPETVTPSSPTLSRHAANAPVSHPSVSVPKRRISVPQTQTPSSHSIPQSDTVTTVTPALPAAVSADVPSVPTMAERLEAIGGALGDRVFIRIFKEESQLEVWMKVGRRYRWLMTYPICKYSGELGPKLREGDRQSPEGFYTVRRGQLNPNSRFHLAFNLGYPNRYDRAHGRTGSYLMVHGNCVSIGCYAMTDAKIEEIYTLVEKALYHGQKQVWVHAYPFRMTAENMQRHSGDRWLPFWQNLREGYVAFERTHLPPKIRVHGQRYIVHPRP